MQISFCSSVHRVRLHLAIVFKDTLRSSCNDCECALSSVHACCCFFLLLLLFCNVFTWRHHFLIMEVDLMLVVQTVFCFSKICKIKLTLLLAFRLSESQLREFVLYTCRSNKLVRQTMHQVCVLSSCLVFFFLFVVVVVVCLFFASSSCECVCLLSLLLSLVSVCFLDVHSSFFLLRNS